MIFTRYENPGVMRRAQLDQIRQVTLARSDWTFCFLQTSILFRIICDNGDNIERVAKNVFLNEDTEYYVDCWKIPKVSLKPWTGK